MFKFRFSMSLIFVSSIILRPAIAQDADTSEYEEESGNIVKIRDSIRDLVNTWGLEIPSFNSNLRKVKSNNLLEINGK